MNYAGCKSLRVLLPSRLASRDQSRLAIRLRSGAYVLSGHQVSLHVLGYSS
jgi:hypothetical protein